jgi:hypothetical protein
MALAVRENMALAASDVALKAAISSLLTLTPRLPQSASGSEAAASNAGTGLSVPARGPE